MTGTAGNDTFEFYAGANPDRLDADGQRREADHSRQRDRHSPRRLRRVRHPLVLRQQRRADRRSFPTARASIQFGSYTFGYANMEYVNVQGKSGSDVATINDSTGDDVFRPGRASPI